MKKITFSLLAVFFTMGLFAQRVAGEAKVITFDKQENYYKNATTALMPPSNSLPCGAAANLTIIEAQGGGSISGTNTYGDTIYAQIYKHQSGSGTCNGFIALLLGNPGKGDLKGSIYTVSSGLPSTHLGFTEPVKSDSLQASKPWTASFVFNTPINLSTDFAVALHIPKYTATGITQCGIISTADGCVHPSYPKLSCLFGTDLKWITFNDAYQNELAIDLQIYPVVDGNFTTSINDINYDPSFSSSIYPNPANDLITVVSLTKIDKLEIYNVTGQLVYTENTNDLLSKVDVSSLNNGNYIVKLHTVKGVMSKKLVIAK